MITIPATVEEKRVIADKTVAISFTVGPDFAFLAGEYVTLTLPQLTGHPLREQFRDFSITSSPEELPRLVITYREGVSEFKKALSGLSPGVEVTLTGPKGVFTLPKDERAPVVFIAGGVGITPFMSMIRSALARQSSRKMSLYYFNHTRESAPYLSELEGYSGQVRFVPVFGPLTEERLSFGEDTAESIWYVAGPPAMVSAAMKLLSSHAVEDARIKTEEFTGYA